MSGSIAKAYVQVLPSAEGIKGNLSNVFNSEMPSAGQSAGGIFGSNLVSAIKSIIVAAGIGKVISESLQEGAALQQSLGGIETLFKDSADLVIANAEQAYKTAGMSANSYMEMVTGFSASLLQGLSGDTEAAAAIADMALTDMSDNANKMGTSMEAIQNAYQGFAKQNYSMLDNLKLGYGGTKTEMERLLADAQKLTGVKYDISNLADVYSAIHVIQEEMDITGTTAKEAASTLSGSFASMKAAFSDVLGNLALGRDIEPSLNALAETTFTFLLDNLLPAVGNILSSLPTVLSAAFSAAIRSMNIAADNADVLLQQGIDLIVGIGSAVVTALPYLAEAALNIVMALGNAIISTDWLQIGQDTINGFRSSLDLAAAEILGTDGNIIQSVMTAIASGLPSVLDGGVNVIIQMSNGILKALPDLYKTAGDLMKQLIETFLSMLPDILDTGATMLSELVHGLINGIPEIISAGAEILADLLATFASHLPDLLQQGFTMIGEMAAGLIKAIPDMLAAGDEIIANICNAFGQFDWLQIGSDILDGIINGILAGAGALWDAMTGLANSALKAAKQTLGIASPSRRFRDEVGKQIPPGVAIGAVENTRPLRDAMGNLSDYTVSSMKSSLRLDMSQLGGSVASGMQSGFSRNVSVVQNIYSEAKSAADLMQEARYQQELAVMLGV